jgi:acetyl esterase/lipase
MRRDITHMGSRENLLGKDPQQDRVNYFSTEEQVSGNTPPAFLVHAEDDTAVPVENSINYFEALKKHNIPAELHIYEKGGHGFGLGTGLNSSVSTWKYTCETWMKVQGLIKFSTIKQ